MLRNAGGHGQPCTHGEAFAWRVASNAVSHYTTLIILPCMEEASCAMRICRIAASELAACSIQQSCTATASRPVKHTNRRLGHWPLFARCCGRDQWGGSGRAQDESVVACVGWAWRGDGGDSNPVSIASGSVEAKQNFTAPGRGAGDWRLRGVRKVPGLQQQRKRGVRGRHASIHSVAWLIRRGAHGAPARWRCRREPGQTSHQSRELKPGRRQCGLW